MTIQADDDLDDTDLLPPDLEGEATGLGQSHVATMDASLAGQRLDKALATILPDLSRARLQALIAAGAVSVDGVAWTDGNARVRDGLVVTVDVPPAVSAVPIAQDIPLDIVFEDEFLAVINKQAGLVVHPGAGNADGTLVNALLAHCGTQLSGIGGVRRPGIVHRLDKDTSGLMVVAKTDAAHRGLSAQLADRSLSRTYLAIVWARPHRARDGSTHRSDAAPATAGKWRLSGTAGATRSRFIPQSAKSDAKPLW